jgi:hypothetical protein
MMVLNSVDGTCRRGESAGSGSLMPAARFDPGFSWPAEAPIKPVYKSKKRTDIFARAREA